MGLDGSNYPLKEEAITFAHFFLSHYKYSQKKMGKEIWVDIDNFDCKYQVSNLGRIRSVSRNVLYSNNSIHFYDGKILKQMMHSSGYYFISIRKGKYRKNKFIHRLVSEYFIPNPNNYPQVNHKDGNKLNNKASNLEWCNASQNGLHAYRMGLSIKKIGSDSSQSKFNNSQIAEIRSLYGTGFYTQYELAKLYNANQGAISRIINNKSYSNV
jgi:hypothetical protein